MNVTTQPSLHRTSFVAAALAVLALQFVLPPAAQAQTPTAPMPTAGKAAADAGTPSPKRLAQREKMKQCNADARTAGHKGAERKQFMKGCLSKKAA